MTDKHVSGLPAQGLFWGVFTAFPPLSAQRYPVTTPLHTEGAQRSFE